jgi:hypothetical protein
VVEASLWTFAGRAGVEPTNNAAERAGQSIRRADADRCGPADNNYRTRWTSSSKPSLVRNPLFSLKSREWVPLL